MLLTPYPKLPSPLFTAKSSPESALTRRARASCSCSYSSSANHWLSLRPNRRFNGFKVKSATVPENVESGGLVKGLKLGGMFGVWYLLNIYYNIFNKQVPSLPLRKVSKTRFFFFCDLGHYWNWAFSFVYRYLRFIHIQRLYLHFNSVVER